MRTDNQHRSRRLETDTALDTDDGVAHMAVAADGVGSTYLFYLLYGLDLIIIFHAVHATNLPFLETEFQQLRPRLRGMFQISALRQSLIAVQNLAATNRRAPDTYVVGILQLREIGIITVLVQIIHFLLTAQVAVARECDDLHPRRHHQEGHVETNLVVACPGRAMGYRVGPHLVGITCDGDGLENTLGRHRNRVTVVAQHITIYHVTQALFIILLRHVQRDVFLGTQLISIFLVGLQLLGAETARVGTSRIHFVPLFLGQIHHRIRGVQTSAECYYYFFCHNIPFILSIPINADFLQPPRGPSSPHPPAAPPEVSRPDARQGHTTWPYTRNTAAPYAAGCHN